MQQSLIDETKKRREEYLSGKAVMYSWDEAMKMIGHLSIEQMNEIEYRRNTTAKDEYLTLDEIEKRLDFE
jgi:hypothetical protein